MQSNALEKHTGFKIRDPGTLPYFPDDLELYGLLGVCII